MLVAPLDWGLGHATRCIPLIKLLVEKGCRVVIASAGPQAAVLREAFPDVEILPLPGYGVLYGRQKAWMKIASQAFSIAKAIKKEHEWLEETCRNHQFDAVISDNRYGLWSSQCKSIIITHQLQPAMPPGLGWARSFVRSWVKKNIKNFDECWVPDIANAATSLSGKLGHLANTAKTPIHFIGWLTRFSPQVAVAPFKYRMLILLSGPEPQRTMLEELLLPQLSQVTGRVLLIRGLPGMHALPMVAANTEVVNHLPSQQLEQAIQQSEYLLSRGGYSTLMDAFTLQKKCIFIPTPGQTEQEYLCRKLEKQGAAVCFSQHHFRLAHALEKATAFDYKIPAAPDSKMLDHFLTSWLKQL